MTDYTELIELMRRAGQNTGADALEQAQTLAESQEARIAELEEAVEAYKIDLHTVMGLSKTYNDEMVKLSAQLVQMREALVEANSLNINWSGDAEPHVLEYFSEYRKVIKQGNEALTLSTAPASEIIAAHDAKVIECVARMVDKKANDYAAENGYEDMGALSFGKGEHATAKFEHHCTLIELAEAIRALIAAPKENSNV